MQTWSEFGHYCIATRAGTQGVAWRCLALLREPGSGPDLAGGGELGVVLNSCEWLAAALDAESPWDLNGAEIGFGFEFWVCSGVPWGGAAAGVDAKL